MLLNDFQYDLPAERIAQHPSARREDARLLRLPRSDGPVCLEHTVDLLSELAQPGDLWVVNDTRVRPARVLLRKESGGKVELLVTRGENDKAFAMYRSSKPLRPGQSLRCENSDDVVTVLDNLGGGMVEVGLTGGIDEVLERAGQIPLPPYIERPPEESDVERYQTVYARNPGAVAAPTAGLHLTDALMNKMEARGARFAHVTLHVGPGTFRPIRSENISEHRVGAEAYEVSEEVVAAVEAAERVVAVGTTSVRTLESVAIGRGRIRAGSGETDLYITPGYDFQVVDAMLTNFHLPGSSLLVLVGAFAGVERALGAYRKALAAEFRFYSYGDAMFIS